MVVNAGRSRTIGRLAIAIGIVCLINALTIVLMYTVAAFFGPLNDIGVAIEGILCAVLAWMLYPFYREQSPHPSLFALIAAIAGGGLAVVGSGLVILRVTGWFLASLYGLLGYAVIGLWVVVLNTLAQRSSTWPRRLTQFGMVIGVIMMLGLFVSPGIVDRVDNPVGAPWYVYVGYAGGFGWFVLLPIWSVSLGRLLLSGGSVERGTQGA